MRRRPPLVAIAVLAALAVPACAPAPVPDAAVPPARAASAVVRLPGTEWVVTALGDERVGERPPLFLAFEDSVFGGYGGCNWLGGRYTSAGDSVWTGPVEMTARACVDRSQTDREARFVATLGRVRRFAVAGDTLRLVGEGDAELIALVRRRWAAVDPAALVGTRWRLVFRGVVAPPAGTRITLAFGRDSIHGDAGCRRFDGTYTLRGPQLGITSLAMQGTECADTARLREEGDFTGALTETRNVQLVNGTLHLHPVSGEVLRFVRDTPAPPPGPSVVLDRTTYTLEPAADLPGARALRIVATYTNRSAHPVFPAPCGRRPPSVTLERQVGERWEPAYEWDCEQPRPCVLPALAPGASRTDTVVFRDHGPRAFPRFLFDPVDGTYRLGYRVLAHYSGCPEGELRDSLAPPAASLSAPFRVREVAR